MNFCVRAYKIFVIDSIPVHQFENIWMQHVDFSNELNKPILCYHQIQSFLKFEQT